MHMPPFKSFALAQVSVYSSEQGELSELNFILESHIDTFDTQLVCCTTCVHSLSNLETCLSYEFKFLLFVPLDMEEQQLNQDKASTCST